MDKLERVRGLMDELSDAIKDCFEGYTRAFITLDVDGYINFSVDKWAPDDGVTPPEALKRRALIQQYRIRRDGNWSKDRSRSQNAYYKQRRVLLEEG